MLLNMIAVVLCEVIIYNDDIFANGSWVVIVKSLNNLIIYWLMK